MYRVGIDIGGTFTDMLLVGEDGSAVISKTLTTPGDPSLAVENTLRPSLLRRPSASRDQTASAESEPGPSDG